MTVRFAAAMLLLSGFTQAELQKAKSTTDFFKDAYWKCLADEILESGPNKYVSTRIFCARKKCLPKRVKFVF